jgi:hypothetical protein
VLFYAQLLARHEQAHLEQIERMINALPMEHRPPQAAS